MQFRFTLLALALAIATQTTAQIRLEYLPDNAAVRQEARWEQEQLEQAVKWFGGDPVSFTQKSHNCPPNIFGTYFVFSGDTLVIEVDTVALGGGENSSLSLLNCEPIDFGTLSFDSTLLQFASLTGIDAGVDTVCVEFCNNESVCDTLRYPIVVKRRGQSHVSSAATLLAEEFLPEYCVDETLLPGELLCSAFLDDCPDNYDGEGQQIVWFTSYNTPSSCVRYQASRFAGTDTVCVVLCDEFTVCDTFRIPFVIQSDTLGLPFFDDFSYRGPYPSAKYWLDKDGFVNRTMSKDPPSVGLLTLDGLDRGGSPYPTIGQADRLTSKYIDLSNTSGDVYLKFFVSPKGYGLLPNEPDSLVLQFRDVQGNWETVEVFDGFVDNIPIDSVPPFDFNSVLIDQAQYLYDGFQFRFLNYVTPGGLYDLWHLDYVWLDDQEGPGSTFDDVAFTQAPPSLLTNYTSMPWRHFEDFVDQEFSTGPLASHFYNHFEETVTISQSAILLRELISGASIPGSDNVVDGPDANIPSKTPVKREKSLSAGTQLGYKTALSTNFPGAEKVDLEIEYRLTVTSQQAEFLRNDTVTYLNRFDNYFAYDDGSAESFLFFDNPQNDNPSLAVKFHTNVADTLRAVQMHFPHVNGNAEEQLFNLYVWVGSLESEPVYEAIFQRPIYADSKFDTLQGFTTYRLQNVLGELTPVALPAGADFYIGFQQVTTTNEGIPIGFDLNNEAQERISIRFFDLWEPLTEIASSFRGALLLRAVVGGSTPLNTSIDEPAEQAELDVSVFPNPTDGKLQVRGGKTGLNSCRYQVFDQLGRPIRAGQLQAAIDLGDLENGLYFLRVFDESSSLSRTFKVTLLR